MPYPSTPAGRRLGCACLLLLVLAVCKFALPARFWNQLEPAARASTLTVTNLNDSGPGSFRQVILDSNATPGQDGIGFAFTNPGVYTISLASALPAITGSVTIDGLGHGSAVQIELDGSHAGANVDGLTISGAPTLDQSVIIQGLVINRFSGSGIVLSNTGGNLITRNRIGTSADGMTDLGNGQHGILVNNSSSVFIGNNIISGNEASGVMITGGNSRGNEITNNIIGTAADSASPLANRVGVSIVGGAHDNIVGMTDAQSLNRNLISRNTEDGVLIESNGNLVSSYILRNGHDGVLVRNGSGNKIGDTVRGFHNVISGNGANGVELVGASNNLVQQSLIGPDVGFYGDPLPNGGDGILLSAGANNNIIGGLNNLANIPDGNIISHNNGAGVRVLDGSGNAVIENRITLNNGAGVFVNTPTDVGSNSTTILSNSMNANGGLGIDLAPAGVSPNDASDVDTGANGLQNFPALNTVRAAGGWPTFIQGTLNSTPNTKFNLQFFNSDPCDASGNGEGVVDIGASSVTTDSSGNAVFSSNLSDGTSQAHPGSFVTATATDPSGNTSEFSPCVQAQDGGLINWDPNSFPAHYQASEGQGSVTLELHRTRSTTGTVTVDYSTLSGTATAGADFTQTSGTIIFNDGESVKTVQIPILEDSLMEADESFTVLLSNPTGGAGIGHHDGDRGQADLGAIVTILANDTPQRIIYAITGGNELVSFSNYTPGTLIQNRPINGEKLLAIDFRPANGELYGLGLSGHLYIINRQTAELTQVGTGFVPNLTELPDIGFDFNPVTDRIRIIVPKDNRNLQVNPETGAISSVDTPLTPVQIDGPDPSPPVINALANSNNFVGATSTTTYGLRFLPGFFTSQLVRLGSIGGSPISPNSGQWFFVNPQSLTASFTSEIAGFDIADMGAAYVSLDPGPGIPTSLYLVNLDDASTGIVGRIGDGSQFIRDISVEPAPTVQFGSSLFSVNEDEGVAIITVTRTGRLNDIARVNYATSDGTANANADYQSVSGTLDFADGEITKTFSIPLINDALIEGVETVNLTLTPINGFNGVSLGVPGTARLAIMDEPTEPGTNPIDNPQFFVRQHYLDFLGREPDAGGLDFWTNNITKCGSDPLCIHQRRIGTSGAFFIEQEFQQTGSFIYRLYKGALGRQPTYAEFSADRPQVVGGAVLDANKVIFADEFVQRPEFITKYQSNTKADSFVDALIATINTSSNVDLASQRATLINTYNTGSSMTQSRSLTVRAAIEDAGFKQVEYNPSFVLMQYFGYLRRDAETGGYLFWLNVLNNKEPNNYRGMVCAFITSAEYQHRFGSTVTRTNRDCSN
jgi:hypothetical protein